DVAVLLGALSLSSYLVLKKRSRRLIFSLMIFSLIYFGFYRKGCVCPIGAIGNIVLSAFDSNYAIPLTALAFFILPLIFTLFFGRVFCGAVCPLGAIQDVVLLKPLPVPSWLESSLRILAYLYLALAVLFAATSSAFVICRYDPFVAFFRLGGNLNIVVLGICFLIIGVFVARPYCRFICPYGVILRQLSRLSRWKVTITPDDCIKCRLCEDACPFGAIEKPTADWPVKDYRKSKKRLAVYIVLVPVLIVLGGWLGSSLSDATSRMNFTVRLADRIYMEDRGIYKDDTDESEAFRATGKPTQQLYQEASVIKDKFDLGGWLLGAFMGFVIGGKLITHSIRTIKSEYEADRAGCYACGRCYEYCPREHVRLDKLKGSTGEV
ncbi:MAG: 4Fe-4S binding protein, partial [Sedimentisphaerales bacterium]|nr:4Fe-4S binding protein [Sedimentisphaerales bacterium]